MQRRNKVPTLLKKTKKVFQRKKKKEQTTEKCTNCEKIGKVEVLLPLLLATPSMQNDYVTSLDFTVHSILGD